MTATITEAGTVWVLRYSHRHGDDLAAFASLDLAYDALVAICREWWDDLASWFDEVPETPDGLADEAIVQTYFDHQDDESWAIENLTVHGSAPAAVIASKDD
jgi:hypothetical protein